MPNNNVEYGVDMGMILALAMLEASIRNQKALVYVEDIPGITKSKGKPVTIIGLDMELTLISGGKSPVVAITIEGCEYVSPLNLLRPIDKDGSIQLFPGDEGYAGPTREEMFAKLGLKTVPPANDAAA